MYFTLILFSHIFSYFSHLQGIFVSHVDANSPASESGVKVGDKLIKVSEIDGYGICGKG